MIKTFDLLHTKPPPWRQGNFFAKLCRHACYDSKFELQQIALLPESRVVLALSNNIFTAHSGALRTGCCVSTHDVKRVWPRPRYSELLAALPSLANGHCFVSCFGGCRNGAKTRARCKKSVPLMNITWPRPRNDKKWWQWMC